MKNPFRTEELLVVEDGQVAATSLPYDQRTAEIAFETATFGIG